MDATPAIGNVAKHATIVVEAAQRRRLVHLAGELSAAAFDDDPRAVQRTLDALSGINTGAARQTVSWRTGIRNAKEWLNSGGDHVEARSG